MGSLKEKGRLQRLKHARRMPQILQGNGQSSHGTCQHANLAQTFWNFAGSAARQPSVENEVKPFCSPLYLQHEGHSRTVVGAERDAKGEISLLLFDPSTDSQALLADVRDKRKLQRLRRAEHTFNHSKYQICLVAPGLAQDEQELGHL